MKSILPILRIRMIYFLLILFLITSGALVVMIFGPDFLSISLNENHPYILNIFFINYTFIGDGYFAFALSVFCLFYLKKKQQGVLLATGFILSGLTMQLIKNSLSVSGFKLFFEQGGYLFFSNESFLANYHSFPSGHTANAFVIATILGLTLKKNVWQFILLAGAILMGISRMYLAQNYLGDILGGAVTGTIAGIISFYILNSIKIIRRALKNIFNSLGGSSLNSGNMVQI